MKRILIGAPQKRYDFIETCLQRRDDWTVQRVRTRDELTVEALEQFRPDWIFLPHWSWRVPDAVYTTYETVIFHMADVPYGRGGSPLQNLVVRGHQDTKLSALRCVKDLDAGDVYLKRDLSLLGTAEEIFLRAARLAAEMIEDIVDRDLRPVSQVGDPVIFARRSPADGDLSPLRALEEVFDYIRMLDGDGYPPAFVDVGRFRFEFSRASLKAGSVMADVRISMKDSADE